jgi:hypothetical protein
VNAPSAFGPNPNQTPSVTIYAPNATGNAAPLQTIAGSNTGLTASIVPSGIALDSNANLYVSVDDDSTTLAYVIKYSAGTVGNIAPSAVLTPAPFENSQLAYDGTSNSLYTLSQVEILGFSPSTGAPGFTLPLSPPIPDTFAVDRTGAIYTFDENDDIAVYLKGATTASRTIVTSLDTGVTGALAVDASGNIYAADDATIVVYGRGAAGNATPSRVISGPNTTLQFVLAIAVDGAGNVYVCDGLTDAVDVFAPGQNGNVAPARRIAGAATGLNLPVALTIGP